MIINLHILTENENKKDDFHTKTFSGDELTSAISEAIIYLQELQQKEMVV